MNKTMHAIGFTQHLPITNPASLISVELPIPTATGHDILVHVTATSVNPVDVGVRGHGTKSLTQPQIIGWDSVGTVTAVGEHVTLFKPGEIVFYAGAFDRPGSNSQYQLVDERIVAHAPTTLTAPQAAAMPLTAITAWEALFEQLGIDLHAHQTNQAHTILIINGAGGVGSIATQLAHLAGLTVIASASRPETITWVQAHGADMTVNHHQNLVTQVHALGYPTVDYILELSNLNRHWDAIVELIKPHGKIVSITGNHKPLNLTALKQKSATFAWEWMYTKSFYHTPDMLSQHHILKAIASLLDTGALQSTLTKTLSPINVTNLKTAHQLVESNQMIGKVVVSDI